MIAVVKKKVVKTAADGTQTISFQFLVDPNMVRVNELLALKKEHRLTNGTYIPFERPPPDEDYAPGHPNFLDETPAAFADTDNTGNMMTLSRCGPNQVTLL